MRPWLLLTLTSWLLAICATGMTTSARTKLVSETIDLFYHGYDNYLEHAFPDDELRPLTCRPLIRDRANPAHIELNDVLGNYSLTLVDSLSTLAIIASAPSNSSHLYNKRQLHALDDFQDSIKLLVEQYGDGSSGARGQGKQARGFDLDSKVQVFETVIRGVGGLLSAHLFAIGELPIRGYTPVWQTDQHSTGIPWKNGITYDGQLLRLARDLAQRLLPAFVTPTLLPYPRVNLRSGVGFYSNSPFAARSEHTTSSTNHQDIPEITETCSAGAGSLVLEFTTLSRLTGDTRFEIAAKNAFWAVWQRRSRLDLIGAGIDAETGAWVTSYSGVGAGTDSFFEYAFKTYILLSGLPYDTSNPANSSSDAFLHAWQDAHAAIQKHVYRGDTFHHPHYIQSDLYTGAARAFWIDSLSAYFPGLLVLAGQTEEATATHLLYTALWTRYSALPERWSTYTGQVEAGLGWWGGRPEFIESSWYLYRATNDPWYLHVAEMALKDIQARCWTPCGWAGLQDVTTGEQSDRMESFFLGETAKYLYLLFDHDHPLNTWDAPFVFTTEGHPIIIPRRLSTQESASTSTHSGTPPQPPDLDRKSMSPLTCPVSLPPLPLSVSNMAARGDIFHAAALARIINPGETDSMQADSIHVDRQTTIASTASNMTFESYPRTLPSNYVPIKGTCAKLMTANTFDLTFPYHLDTVDKLANMQRVPQGIFISSMSGVRLSMVHETDSSGERYRIYALGSLALGRDEKVFMARQAVSIFNPLDPYFTRVRDRQRVDLLVDVFREEPRARKHSASASPLDEGTQSPLPGSETKISFDMRQSDDLAGVLSSFVQNIHLLLRDSVSTSTPPAQTSMHQPSIYRHILNAAIPTGPGAAPFENLDHEPPDLEDDASVTPLAWKSIYHVSHDLCSKILDPDIPRRFQVLLVPRGGCNFSTKLQHIPSFPPSPSSLQLVIVAGKRDSQVPETSSHQWATSPHDPTDEKSFIIDQIHEEEDDDSTPPSQTLSAMARVAKSYDNTLLQPYLHKPQLLPSGIPRPNPIPMILIEAEDDALDILRHATGIAVRRQWWFESQKIRINNAIVL